MRRRRRRPDLTYECRDCHEPLTVEGWRGTNKVDIQRWRCPSCGWTAIVYPDVVVPPDRWQMLTVDAAEGDAILAKWKRGQ
jgi:hypothetical protein